MNEKIKNLWDTALEEFSKEHQFATIMLPEPLREKFAELIVRECIELAMNERLRYSSSYDKQADWAKKLMMIHCATSMDNYKILLQEHFGVEE